MAAMIVPEMKGSMEDALLRSSARQVVDVLNLTYSRAISQNQQHRVLLDPKTGQYRVEQQNEGFGDSRDFLPITDMSELRGQIDSRIVIELRSLRSEPLEEQMPEDELMQPSLRDGIHFYPDGTADGCEIVLRDRMGVELVLQLNPITASVQIVEQEPP